MTTEQAGSFIERSLPDAPGGLQSFCMKTEIEAPSSLIRAADFSEILPIWHNELWPGRESVIEPSSAVAPSGAIDMAWHGATPHFWKITEGKVLLGVVSGLFLTGKSARIRGLWVAADARGKSHGKTLLQAVIGHGIANDFDSFWTMARHSAVGFYKSCGFEVDRIVGGYEFGPHTIMTFVRR
jgi:ribosomal protein S18 acetylase RimI-like enzyme